MEHDEHELLILELHVGELEVDLLAGQLLVDGGEGLHLVLDVRLLGLVQVDLEQARPVQPDPGQLGRQDFLFILYFLFIQW